MNCQSIKANVEHLVANLTRLVAVNGLGQRFCVEKRRDLGKHSCNRS